jgi:organic radical activating enzyme
LHNTQTKKLERKEMIAGNKPMGCKYCWNIEKLGPEHVSDRHIRNASIYTPSRLEEVKQGGWEFNVLPEYVEISFGNECQMSCMYCHPKASSAWHKEIQQQGPYNTSTDHQQYIDKLQINKEEDNPFVAAWWAWWPTLAPNLNILRVTGGEPLLHTSMWKLLELLDNNPQPKLELDINSNLSIKPVLVERLVTKINLLESKKNIKHFKLFTSIDTWGPRAEYIRNGMDLTVWEQNMNTYLSGLWSPISLMITYNALSVSSFRGLLEKILEWRGKYNSADITKSQRIRFDTPHLTDPKIFNITILPKDTYLPIMEADLAFMAANVDNNNRKFTNLEVDKFKRIVEYMRQSNIDDATLRQSRKNLYNWLTERDRRYKKSFTDTFPEMIDFWNSCKS